ncbi:uncharacterized protein CLAFUR5_07848 [Fulvia fulva]|uniref:Uncharacterized protein n=1 Tax=Passalora fulva TaxID=5499 RepID=A0A9Q8P6K0_PASFU|nr:uncharacterized protein CLAFUR5_07848 [Fulvia fulva]KAK4630254.1 hypothetical protein CLAFUR0_07723 [Fulvia fulva]UJO14912.1 hypothetical protein CLAFUR5_07848 [Fulvia fulva]WPV27052.1 hypothetical protein CLAFUW7_07721 [Fulvia fulva]
MDDDVDMTGSGNPKTVRLPPLPYEDPAQSLQKAERMRYSSARHHSQQDHSAESQTPIDSNATESTSDSAAAHNNSIEEDLPRSTPSIVISPRDPNIKCACPAGTVRFQVDLELSDIDGVPTWLHKPCMSTNPLNQANISGSTGESSANASLTSDTATATKRVDPEQLAAKLFGPEATAEQRVRLKHFTSEFRCDGPCTGSTKIDDYSLCNKCSAWQHKECMLYGEEGDVGGPICNRCFMIFLARRETTIRWQRKQMLHAVQEAWKFFRDPANRHQVERRAHARKFLAAFFLKNQDSFFRFVARKKADRLAAGLPPSDQDGDTEMDVDDSQALPQNMSMIQSSPSAASGDGLDDLEELERRLSTDNEGAMLTDGSPTRAPRQARRKPQGTTKAEVRAALAARTSRQKLVPLQQGLVGPTLPRLKPAPARLKPVPSQQSTGAAKRKRQPSPSDGMASPADSTQAKSSAPRKSAPGTAPRKPGRPAKAAKQVTFDVPESVTRGDSAAPTLTPSPYDKVACKCRLPSKLSKADCFTCIECGTSQHRGCHDDTSGPRPALCNFCFNSTAATKRSINEQVIATMPASQREYDAATRLAKATRSVQINGVDEYTDSFREAVTQESHLLCSTTLWKEWWNIPYPGQANKITPMPPIEPPEEWLKEAKGRLEKLLFAAGRETTIKYLQPVLKQWPRNDYQVMVALRELALEMVHRGAYRGKRAELGVIAEVVGIERKGMFWKGV